MSTTLIDTYSSAGQSNTLLLSHVRTIVKFYIWPLLVIFGLTGNCISILILTRQRLIRTSTNNYLTILAAFDSCYLVFTLLLNIGSHKKFAEYSFIETILYVLRPLADFSSNTATWLIVCFTLERTLAVAKPIYAKRTCSVRRSRHLICTLLIVCFFITLPTFFEDGLTRENYDNSMRINSTEKHISPNNNDFYRNLHRLYLIFICIIIIWIPLIIICTCNLILIWYVHRSRHFDDYVYSNNGNESSSNSPSLMDKFEYTRSNYKRSSSSKLINSLNTIRLRRHSRTIIQKRRVTIILIICLFVALLLWTPQSLSLTYETFIESYSEMSARHQVILLIFNNFANLFLCINASIDFLLYCFLSEKFARTCKQILCRRCSNDGNKMRSLNDVRTKQLPIDRPNKCYIQFYDFYRKSPALDYTQNIKLKTKINKPSPNVTDGNHVVYQKNLLDGKQKPINNQSPSQTLNTTSTPVLDSTYESQPNN